MKAFLLKKWFLIGLLVMISVGLVYGASSPDHVSQIKGLFRPRLLTACVLFLMSVTLDSGQLRKSFRAPSPVVTAVALNYAAIPLAAWGLMSIQLTADFRYGLMIAGSVPCTMAAASVWTRKAKGNDAVSLLVTLTTNGLCFAVTPFWINLAVGSAVADLDRMSMVQRLVEAVLIPCTAGQLLRAVPRVAKFATKSKVAIGAVAQSLILVLVLFGALTAGGNLAGAKSEMPLAAVFMVWGSCIAIHLASLSAGYTLSNLLGFSRKDAVAVAFAGSQKTLPIGVYIATDPTMLGGYPFAVFPMLMYHASQLFIDTAIADRWALRAPPDESDDVM